MTEDRTGDRLVAAHMVNASGDDIEALHSRFGDDPAAAQAIDRLMKGAYAAGREAGADSWGFGRGSLNYRTKEWEGIEQRPFDHATIGNKRVPLLRGEHPHSRRDSNDYALLHLDGEPVAFDGHRRHVKVVVETSNYYKSSGLSGDEVRRSGKGAVYVDDVQVAELGPFREIEQGLLGAINEVNKQFGGGVMGGMWEEAERCSLLGRRVYLDGTPAVITRLIPDQGCVWVEPAGGEFPPSAWCIEEACELGRDPSAEWRDHGYHDGQKVKLGSRSLWMHRNIPANGDEQLQAKAKDHGGVPQRMLVLSHAESLLREAWSLLRRNGIKAHIYDVDCCGEGVRIEMSEKTPPNLFVDEDER